MIGFEYTPIPQEVFDYLGRINVNFFVGDELVHNATIEDSGPGEIQFVVPSRLLEGNRHVIRVESDTWVPAELLGSDDWRNLGIRFVAVRSDAVHVYE